MLKKGASHDLFGAVALTSRAFLAANEKGLFGKPRLAAALASRGTVLFSYE